MIWLAPDNSNEDVFWKLMIWPHQKERLEKASPAQAMMKFDYTSCIVYVNLGSVLCVFSQQR